MLEARSWEGVECLEVLSYLGTAACGAGVAQAGALARPAFPVLYAVAAVCFSYTL
jgi:hypothetical protein